MKTQDILFLVILLFLIAAKSPKIVVAVGVIMLIMAALLFQLGILFTAERLTWYAAAFFLLSILLYLRKGGKNG